MERFLPVRRISALLVCIVCLCGSCLAAEAPVPLVSFAAKEGQAVDLSKAVELHGAVNHCLYGEPEQVITDAAIVQQAAKAVSAMTVNGLRDRVSSTGTYYNYCFLDADGASLLGVSFQDGLLMRDEGRYDVSGLNALFAIEGVLLADDWEDYWAKDDAAERDYLRNLSVSYPASIFDVRGYAASRLRKEAVTGVEIYVSWNDEAGRLSTSDPQTIARVFDALQGLRATGSAPEDGDGLTYFVTLYYTDPEKRVNRSVWFRFEGERLACDEKTYAVSGLEGLFASADADVLQYLREHFMD